MSEDLEMIIEFQVDGVDVGDDDGDDDGDDEKAAGDDDGRG